MRWWSRSFETIALMLILMAVPPKAKLEDRDEHGQSEVDLHPERDEQDDFGPGQTQEDSDTECQR